MVVQSYSVRKKKKMSKQTDQYAHLERNTALQAEIKRLRFEVLVLRQALGREELVSLQDVENLYKLSLKMCKHFDVNQLYWPHPTKIDLVGAHKVFERIGMALSLTYNELRPYHAAKS